MSYKPLTKQQANDMSRPPLIEDGIYSCMLLAFYHKDKNGQYLVDKSGGRMTRITLRVWDANGSEKTVYTNLFWGEDNKMSYRTRHFAESFKIVDKYENGDLYDKFSECIGLNGICEIYTQKERSKNDGTSEVWPAKNDVRTFIEKETSISAVSNKNEDIPFQDDELPF